MKWTKSYCSSIFYQGCIWFLFTSVYGWADTARSINRVSQSSRTRGRFAGVNRPTAVYTVLVFLFVFGSDDGFESIKRSHSWLRCRCAIAVNDILVFRTALYFVFCIFFQGRESFLPLLQSVLEPPSCGHRTIICFSR